VYAKYLKTCAAIGVEPMSEERMRELVESWNRLCRDGKSGGQRISA